MFVKYVSVFQFFGLLALCVSYKVHPFVTPDIPSNTNLTTCPFVRIGNGFYFFETTNKKNWYEAYATCRKMDAELITIETIEEWNLINRYLRENDIYFIYWTSGTDQAKEGTHFWFTSGEPIDLPIWAHGLPDNEGEEDCVELGWKSVKIDGLNDCACSYLHFFICEKQAPVTASFLIW